MRFMFQYPDLHGSDGDLLDAGSVTDVAAAVEAAGWSGMAFTEHPVPGIRWLASGGHQTLDPFVALGAVAAVTRHIRLLTYLTVLPYRNPFLVAKAAATVDKLSNGRFVLGVGTGYLKGEFRALGVDFDERNELFDEALDALPMHWSGAPFDYRGTHFEARDAIALPRPVQTPIPVWIGGNARITLRRVAERAQGWMPLVGPPELAATTRTPAVGSIADIAERLGMLRELAGERSTSLDVAVPFHVSSMGSLVVERGRYEHELGLLQELGVTWVIVVGPWGPNPQVADFAGAFADGFIRSG
jgi:probable F420-dependent oxidoreductase